MKIDCSPRSRQGWDIVTGALSIAVWVMMPKCPVCLAAHVALWTGLGLSFAEAAYLRSSLLLLGGVALSYVLAKQIRMRWMRGARLSPPTGDSPCRTCSKVNESLRAGHVTPRDGESTSDTAAVR